MGELLENEVISGYLQSMSASDFFIRISALIMFIGVIGGVAVKMYQIFEKYRKLRNETEEKEKMIYNHQETIDILKKNDDKTFRQIDSMMNELKQLKEMVCEMKKFNDSNECAALKDRISQAYSHYHEKQEWTNMQKESMEDLIRAYEKYSNNSFVHDIVQKEMYTWKIIDDE